MSPVTRIAWIVLVVVPPLQWALERGVAWPVAPSRLLAIALWLGAWGPIAAWAAAQAGERGRSRAARAGVLFLAPLLGAAILLGVVRLSGGPFGPVPGGRLRGIESAERQPDWRHTDALRYVALELESGRSLEMLCIRDGPDLYVAANYPESKRWPHEVRREPGVVVRVDGTLYPRRAVFIDDDERRRALLQAMNAKYGFDVSLGTGRIWFFRLDPRPCCADPNLATDTLTESKADFGNAAAVRTQHSGSSGGQTPIRVGSAAIGGKRIQSRPPASE